VIIKRPHPWLQLDRIPEPMTSSQARAGRCRARLESRIDCALHIPYQRAEVKPEFTCAPVKGFNYTDYDIAMLMKFTKNLSHPFVPTELTIPSLQFMAAYEASREMLNNKVLILEYCVDVHPYYEALKHQLEHSNSIEIVRIQADLREEVVILLFIWSVMCYVSPVFYISLILIGLKLAFDYTQLSRVLQPVEWRRISRMYYN